MGAPATMHRVISVWRLRAPIVPTPYSLQGGFALMTIPDILQYLNLVRTSTGIRLCQVITKLISTWFAAAGFVHLVSGRWALF